MIHSLCVLLSISKTLFAKLPIRQQHLCLPTPRDAIGVGRPVLQSAASFMSFWKSGNRA